MKIACDQCETVTDEHSALGWIEVHSIGADVRRLCQTSIEGRYCSAACLVARVTGPDCPPVTP